MTLAPPHPHYPKAEFLEPETCGFIYFGMSIDPPRRTPLVGRSSAREQEIERITTTTQVQASTTYHRLNPAFSMIARNVRRIGQTDSTRSATFLVQPFHHPRP